MWFLFALLSGFCAALLAILVKLYLKNFNPFFITFLFSIIAVVMLIIIDITTQKIQCSLITKLTLKDWLPLIAAGCLNGLAFTFYMIALKFGKTCGVIAIDRLGILFAVIMSVIFLQEALTIKAIIGSLLMVFGCGLLIS